MLITPFCLLGLDVGGVPVRQEETRDETGPQKVEGKTLLVPPSLSEYAQILP